MGSLIVNHLQKLDIICVLLKLAGVKIPALCSLSPINGLKTNDQISLAPRIGRPGTHRKYSNKLIVRAEVINLACMTYNVCTCWGASTPCSTVICVYQCKLVCHNKNSELNTEL